MEEPVAYRTACQSSDELCGLSFCKEDIRLLKDAVKALALLLLSSGPRRH